MPTKPLTQEERATLNTMIKNPKGISTLLFSAGHHITFTLTEPRVDFYQPGDRTFHLGLPDGSFRDVPLEQIVKIHLR
jgi:hypothetical protein